MGITVSVRCPNSADARATAAGVRPETIWGSEWSSSMALPSAMRSGQKVTSIVRPWRASSRSTRAVTPG